jgi:hypothetical protein
VDNHFHLQGGGGYELLGEFALDKLIDYLRWLLRYRQIRVPVNLQVKRSKRQT